MRERGPRGRRLLSALLAAVAVWIPASAAAGGTNGGATAPQGQPAYAVGVATFRLVDPSRTIRLRDGRSEPRILETVVRYPAVGAVGPSDLSGAPPARASGPYPLVVFAHGFAVTPSTYARLLHAWAQAGYVVAAPAFPLERAGAPGGPDESDLVNEPADISFVISRMLAASAAPSGSAAPVASLIDPSRIAVAGQSDGGEAALAAAYSRDDRDRRISAAMVLSGAEMEGVGGYAFAPGEPALLAVQGTADPINEPRYTYEYFRSARRPKYLLRLLGAQHLPPYTGEQPQLSVVERTTIAFLDAYVLRTTPPLPLLSSTADVPHVATLTTEP